MSYSQDPFRARPHTVTATPKALLGVASHAPAPDPATAYVVPDRASDVVAWLNAVEGAERATRARVAKSVESDRDGGPRKTVVAAIEAATQGGN